MRGSVVFRDLCMGFGFVWLYNPVSMIGPVRISVWGLDFFGIVILGMDFGVPNPLPRRPVTPSNSGMHPGDPWTLPGRSRT